MMAIDHFFSRRSDGFTLIELMITVAVLAIIAAIAIPSYTRYSYRARRTEGQQLLLKIANAEERYYATNNAYADLKAIGYSAGTTATSENGYYTVVVSKGASGSWQSFSARAEAAGIQAEDTCGALAITDAGAKTPGPTDTKNSNGNCW